MKSIAATDRHKHKQLFSLNLIRAVAIIMVVLDHSLRRDISAEVDFLTRLIINPDAVLFFMVSGALLLPVKGSYAHFLRHRIVRVFVPFVVWVILTALCFYWLGRINEYTLALQIRWYWLSGNSIQCWFVPAIMSLYFVMPLLSPWIATASRRHFHYVIIVWLISGLLPFIEPISGIDPLTTPLQLFFNAVPYAIAGYYLTWYRYRQPLLPSYMLTGHGGGVDVARARRRARRVKLTVLYTSMLMVGIVVPFVVGHIPLSFDFQRICCQYSGMSLTTVVMAIFYFSLLVRVRTLGPTLDKAVNLLARYSYGIYLSHWLLGSVLFRYYFPAMAESTAAVFAASLGGGIIITALLRRVPFLGRYIV